MKPENEKPTEQPKPPVHVHLFDSEICAYKTDYTIKLYCKCGVGREFPRAWEN